MQDPLNIRNKSCTLCPLYEGASNVCIAGEGPALKASALRLSGEGPPLKRRYDEASSEPPLSREHGQLPVLILGEAPGREEDAAGRPFVGASGKLLRSALKIAKIPYEQCYITNTVKCFPHGTPKEKEIAICTKTYLRKEIDLLNPAFILAVGGTALMAANPTLKITASKGKLHESWLGDVLVFPIWHPAYILRNRSKQAEWEDDLAKFRALLEVDLKVGLDAI